MDNKEFDKWINDSIERVDKSRFLPEWDAFEQKSRSPLSDDEFDQVIHEKLSNSGPGYRHAHWLDYLYKAALVKLFKFDLIYNKAFEALILGLALLWIIPVYHPGTDPMPQPIDFAFKQTGDSNTNIYNQLYLSESLLSNENPELNSVLRQDNASIEYGNSLPIPDHETASMELFSSNLIWGDVVEIKKSVQVEADQFHSINFLASRPINFLTYSDKQVLFLEGSIGHKDDLAAIQVLSIMPLEPIDLTELNLLNTKALALHKSPKWNREKFQWVYSSFVTADVNTIHTPYDEIYQKRGYEQSKFGMGGGFSAGLMRNGWMLELGLLYSMKQYNPQRVLEVFRFRSETARAISLKSIELNTLSIPLNIRYDFVSRGRWIPHLKMGLGLNIATHANYEREEFLLALRAPIPAGANINPSEEPKLDNKRFTDGIFQGGKFNENSYLSANVALGIDFVIHPNWRIFKQGSYHNNFLETKLGPNNDHINTFSIQLGVRYLPD